MTIVAMKKKMKDGKKMKKSPEDKIRHLMRYGWDVNCPSCGGDCLRLDSKYDTDLGIMDEMTCDDCEASFVMISSVNTQFVLKS